MRTPLTLLLLAGALLAGCEGETPADDDATPDDDADPDDDAGPDDDATPDDDASSDDDVVVEELTATFEVSPLISTVGTVRWSTPEPGTSVVEYGPDGNYGFSTPDDGQARTEHAVMLAGIPTSSTWHWRARSDVGDETLVSPDQTVTTQPAPSVMPVITRTAFNQAAASPGYRSTSFLGASGTQAAIIGRDGRYVWWVDEGTERLISRSVVSHDKRHVHYLNQGADREVDTSEVVTWSLDLREEVHTRVVMGHHDFVEIPGDRFAYLKLTCREFPEYDYPVCGDTIVEVDLGDPDGSSALDIWDTFDPDEGIPMDVSEDAVPEFYPQGIDWLHGNGIAWEESLGEAGGYLYSSRNLSSVSAIDRTTGQKLWTVGGDDEDFALNPGDRKFVGQHAPDLIDGDHLLVFDNGAVENAALQAPLVDSAVREYYLDYGAEPPAYEGSWHYVMGGFSILLGDVERLENGNTLISWGSLGVMNEVSPELNVVWEATLAIGNTYAFASYHEQIGGPLP